MNEQELQQIKDIQMKQLSGMFVTPSELSSILKVIMKAVKDLRAKVDSEKGESDEKMEVSHKEMMKYIANLEEDFNRIISNIEKKEEKEISRLQDHITNAINTLKASIPSMPDLSNIEAKINEVEAKIPVIKDTILDTPEQIRDKIESLKGNERVDKSAIKGLEEEIADLRKELATRLSGLGGGSRRVFQPYVDDFSSETDGVTKTFYLSREPLKTNTILVWGSDFPIILRPTTDFTVSGKTLTLTAAVPAPSQGATLLIQYHA